MNFGKIKLEKIEFKRLNFFVFQIKKTPPKHNTITRNYNFLTLL